MVSKPPTPGKGDGSVWQHEAIAMAAYAISESLALALVESGVMDRREVEGLLQDAASAYRNVLGTAETSESHLLAARLIERVLSGVKLAGRQSG